MARRSTTRRVLKWGGTAVCVLLVGLFVVSAWYRVVRSGGWGRDTYNVEVFDGSVSAQFARDNVFGMPRDCRPRVSPYGSTRASAWRTRLSRLNWLPRVQRLSVILVSPYATDWIVVTVPLWIPLLLIALPTAFLWWRDRRIPPGNCQKCGYNLTGNVSGVCPECGTPITQPSKGQS